MLLMIITCVFSHFLTGTRIISRFIKSVVPSLTYLSTIERFHNQRQLPNCTFSPSLTLQCANWPSSQRQASLDNTIIWQSHVPPFSTQGLVDHLVKLVVSQDYTIQLVDKDVFCCLLMYIHPSLQDKDMLHHTKLCMEIIEQA